MPFSPKIEKRLHNTVEFKNTVELERALAQEREAIARGVEAGLSDMARDVKRDLRGLARAGGAVLDLFEAGAKAVVAAGERAEAKRRAAGLPEYGPIVPE